MSHGKVYTVVFMVLLSCLFGAAIAGLSIVSRPAIERNDTLIQQRAFVSVFGLDEGEKLTDDEVLARVKTFVEIVPREEAVIDPKTGTVYPLLRAYEDAEHSELKAIAFKFRGLGFWAPIEGWLALTPDRTRTVGIVITRQSETPGLGGRITEPIFTEPFAEGVLVTPAADGAKYILLNSNTPPEGTEQAERHVEAITGATQTCMAMETILNDALQGFARGLSDGEGVSRSSQNTTRSQHMQDSGARAPGSVD